MVDLTLVGIGTGNPDHITGEGRKALRSADLILIPRKGAAKADLADLRRHVCAQVLGQTAPRIVEFNLPVRDAGGDYRQGVEAWHDAIAHVWAETISGAGAPRKVALLIWGDPSLYDSSLRIARRLSPVPRLRVVPGITAIQALCAAHCIPLNAIGAPVVITTGRRLRDEGWPEGADTAVVMLDGDCAFRTLPPEGIKIWWGAYLGMAEEILFSGPLAQTGPRILEARAAARARHGWIMDIYLLRRQEG
ncbi:precorrin-6A synthase (deacetylating) [Rhodovulum imhoffii]|uniref:Precorrin-6A synthase [deacetylating] n=1 Tax=Rhodovulum imhoffii TaxID=365340 RepID=A0A2T5BRC7_9RHOB|nr:precorrin-6A synthase (deacetylating) [Rhodovulum imhoffii]MBK5934462.1 precorrin-6A synthase (deacetylating) [Rhodovulum imhoffii]PTN01810.1 precorrin-6A synthase (deacetylating) [Rhodovulum imhoffii]